MEKLLTRKEEAEALGICIKTLDAIRSAGLISYVQYVANGGVYFTESALEEYVARGTHRAKPREMSSTYRNPRKPRR